jgi:hypothetical protein
MDVRLSPLTLGAIIAIVVLLLAVIAFFVPGMWTREFVLGALAALAVARLC